MLQCSMSVSRSGGSKKQNPDTLYGWITDMVHWKHLRYIVWLQRKPVIQSKPADTLPSESEDFGIPFAY